MAQPDPKIIQDEDEFLVDLEEYHKQRGTTLDKDPRVSGRSVPLHKLYHLVMERGGYDKLSAERMAWRQLVRLFGFPSHQEGAQTFQIKTVYYKNLAAYEIEKYWGETPPPKEILEDLTAKGGHLRMRTLDNYPAGGSRESLALADNQDSASESPMTPKAHKTEAEELGSGGRYPTRNLRQDPKRTQLFQPEILSTRARAARASNSPQPQQPSQPSYSSASSDPRNPSFNIQNYEPRQPMALTLKAVITPGTRPDIFYQQKALAKAQSMPKPTFEPQHFLKHAVHNMGGPNIYLRCLYGLRSGIPSEQSFALHHLVKVSFERGDKYRFEGFPLLAESLLEKALEIIELVYGVAWEISYNEPEGTAPENTLNAAYGTPDLLYRIGVLKAKLESDDDVADGDFDQMERLNEAALVLRNMLTLEDNAKFASQFPMLRDFITIAITLPPQSRLEEFQLYGLEMAEQVTRYFYMERKDPLYLSLLTHLQSPNRAVVLSAIRAINRIGIELDSVFAITDVPLQTLERLTSLILLEADDELVEACLDFLYELTATYENNSTILASQPKFFTDLIPRLIPLMNHNPTTTEEKILSRPKAPRVIVQPSIPAIPADLHQQLLQYPEPQRSSRWLKCCFEESREDDITQIAIWQAYQGRFQHNSPIPAADFIKNVSTTFNTAQAQVINGPQPRFIIKGIRPRRILVDTLGQPYFRCFWENTKLADNDHVARQSQKHLCNVWHSNRKNLWTHMLKDHLGISQQLDGRFDNSANGEYRCQWTGCMRVSPFTKPNDIGAHLRSHIPDTAEDMSKLILELAGVGPEKEPEMTKHTSYFTAIDADGHPVGISFMSVMILRNLARWVAKQQQQQGGGSTSRPRERKLMEECFGAVMREIWHVFSLNRTLRGWLGQLIGTIEKGGLDVEKVGVKREREAQED